MLLQAGFGAPVYALAVALAVALVAAYGGVVYWVYRDAAARGSDRARTWALGVALFAPTLLAYLVGRRRIGERTVPETERERLARVMATSVLVAWAVAATLAPPDPVTQLYYAAGAVAVTALAGYLFVVRDRSTAGASR